ncbi:MAG: hypothetical protein HYR85_04750 [Planctomycetes bacterium]|nr:hypothetical protein [Planctomycetota bacterium]MBI3844156.1 hypothetical protein [Planctomycetota bacterium]
MKGDTTMLEDFAVLAKVGAHEDEQPAIVQRTGASGRYLHLADGVIVRLDPSSRSGEVTK